MVGALWPTFFVVLVLITTPPAKGFGSVIPSGSSRTLFARTSIHRVSRGGGMSTFSCRSKMLAATSAESSSSTSDHQIIPREVLFGNPKYTSPKLSPDGKYISFLAPSEDLNVLNVFVKRTSEPLEQARMITNDKSRGIRNSFWAEDSKTVLYMQDFEVRWSIHS